MLTNMYGYPDLIYQAMLKWHDEHHSDGISVTELIDSPLIWHLKNEYGIKADVQEQWKAFWGSVKHKFFGYLPEGKYHIEKELKFIIADQLITGTPDVWTPNQLMDFKNTSVESYQYHKNDDSWLLQLNIYRYLIWKVFNIAIPTLTSVVAFDNWSQQKSVYDKSYPRKASIEVNQPVMSFDQVEQYIKIRIGLFNNAKDYICSPEDRWEKPTQYAVRKVTSTKCIKLCNTVEEADALIAEKSNPGDYTYDVRQGESERCERWCPVRHICSQKNETVSQENELVFYV